MDENKGMNEAASAVHYSNIEVALGLFKGSTITNGLAEGSATFVMKRAISAPWIISKMSELRSKLQL